MSAADTVLLQLRAKELCVRNAKSKWSPLGDHGSAPVVVWVTERAAESYFLQVQRAEDDEQAHFSSSEKHLLCCKITTTLDYTVAEKTLHYFGVDASTEYGLRFYSPSEAMVFMDKIIDIKAKLLKANGKKKRNARRRHQAQAQALPRRCERIVEEAEPRTNGEVSPPSSVHNQVEERLSVKEQINVRIPEKDVSDPDSRANPARRDVPAAAAAPEFVDAYVKFYLEDTPTPEETEAAVLQAKKDAAKRHAESMNAESRSSSSNLPHPYATIDEQEGSSTVSDKPVKRHDVASSSPEVAKQTVVTIQPLPSTAGSASPSATTSIARTVDHNQAPATAPRAGGQPRHKKVSRQVNHQPVPRSVHMSNQKQLEDHQLWITHHEREVAFHKEKMRKKQERGEAQLPDTEPQQQVLRQEPQQQDTHLSPCSNCLRPDLLRTAPIDKQPSGSPSPDTSKRKVSSLSQIGALMSEEVRRDRLSKYDISTEKLPITTEPKKQLHCVNCGETFFKDANRPGDCEEGPSLCKSAVHFISCLSLAHCLTYCCAADQENEYVFPFQCNSDGNDTECCKRWTVLCAAGICCPCLFCYWPLKACMDIGGALHICGARHEHEHTWQDQGS